MIFLGPPLMTNTDSTTTLSALPDDLRALREAMAAELVHRDLFERDCSCADEPDEVCWFHMNEAEKAHSLAYVECAAESRILSTVAALTEERDALKADKARMDWLDAERAMWGNPPLSRNATLTFHIHSWSSFRDHIDRTRARSPEETP